jgi:hypothetical protein
MFWLVEFLRAHGTKVLGFLQGTIAAVAGVTGIIPESHLKYYMAAIALLTFWRGFINTELQKRDQDAGA